ncbi:unnamed protein product, partial [Symbiodinium necroappetens]
MGFRGVRTTRLQALAAAVAATWCWGCGVLSQAWLLPQAPAGRREVLGAGLAGLGLAIEAEPALASGGSTAGKYSTIPSGKRRFYGRVKQGLYQYLQMEPAIKAGNLKDPLIEDFFSKNIIKVKGGEDIKNCGFGAKCKTKEKRTSRWLDFKTASDLLAGAFRYSAEDIPEYLPQVKIIRSFAKKVEKMEAAIEAGNAEEAQQLYAKSKLDLSRYLPQVELEPLDSQDYTHPWDTRPEARAQEIASWSAKTYTFTFANESNGSAKILLEEDPEGVVKLEEWKVGDGIPIVGKAEKRHSRRVRELKKSILATSKPFQEFVLIRDQLKTVHMRSPVCKCSIALTEWNGSLKIVEVQRQVSETETFVVHPGYAKSPGIFTLRADLLEHALRAVGLQLGFDLKDLQDDESEIPDSTASKRTSVADMSSLAATTISTGEVEPAAKLHAKVGVSIGMGSVEGCLYVEYADQSLRAAALSCCGAVTNDDWGLHPAFLAQAEAFVLLTDTNARAAVGPGDMSKGHLAIGSHGAIDTAATTVTSTRTASLRSVTGKPFAVADEADEALNAGAVAAAELRGKGQKPHQQAIAAADAATRAAKAAGRPFEQVAFASAKAAALAVQTAGGSLQQGCVEAGRAASYAAKSEQTVAIPAASSNAAFSALRSMGLPDGQMTECLALAVKTACKANGTQPESLAECAGSTAMAAAQHAGMTEDEQAEVAGKAVQVITVVTDSPEPEAVETTENPELQVLIREVEEAKKAAQDAAIAAGMAHVEAEKAKAEAKVSTTTSPPTTTVPSNATFETEVIVTEAPKPASATAAPSITTPAAQNMGGVQPEWGAQTLRRCLRYVGYSATPILHSCLVRSIKDRVPDECCSANGAENMVGATFQELYYSNEYGTCPTLTFAGPLAGTRVKLQCNFDNTITYGESRCGADCSCAFEDVYGPGCYRASDALPGTAWFFMTAGCDCTDAKAVQPHQFSLPPLDQNVRAGDILNVGPEEAAKAMNRQRQQLRTFHDEMVKDEQ